MGLTTWPRKHRSQHAPPEIRRRCEALLADLDVPEPFDLDVLMDRLARSRDRPLTVVPYPMRIPGGPSGMWVALAEADVIFVDSATSGTQHANIVAHELGHIVAGHGVNPSTLLDDATVASLLPLPASAGPRAVLHRTSYSAPQEQEAELFASLLLGRGAWHHIGEDPSVARFHHFFAPQR